MKASELQHGDVLLYDWRSHAAITTQGIRLVTGNANTHCSVVQEIYGNKFVLEQLGDRMHSFLPFYYAMEGEEITCFRPKFPPPPADPTNFTRNPYGYLCIADALLNHCIGLFSKRRYKPRIVNLFKSKNIDCGVLVGRVLELEENASWCYDVAILEPDDFIKHPESFSNFGVVDWRS